jgi:hypothetical protein
VDADGTEVEAELRFEDRPNRCWQGTVATGSLSKIVVYVARR